MSGKKGDYEVGYGKPPRHTQFKKGQSGNTKGRPKGAGELDKYHLEEANTLITVTMDGRPRKVSKGRIAVRQQWDRAAKGDPRAFETLTRRMDMIEAKEEARASGATASVEQPRTELPEAAYDAALTQFLATYRAKEEGVS